MKNNRLENADRKEILALKRKALMKMTRRYKALNAKYLRGCYRKESDALQVAVDEYNEINSFCK